MNEQEVVNLIIDKDYDRATTVFKDLLLMKIGEKLADIKSDIKQNLFKGDK